MDTNELPKKLEPQKKTEPQKKKGMSSRILKFFLLCVVLLGFIFVVVHYSANQSGQDQQTQVTDNLAVLNARLDNLEKTALRHEDRLKEVEQTTKKLTSAPAASATAPAVSSATPPTESAAPSSGQPSGTSDERIAALEKQIADLKAIMPMQSPENIGQSIRLLSAFHHFSGKVLSGMPFAAELSAFEELDNPDESAGSPVATLAPFASNGIPTFATLLASFDLAVDSLNAAQAVPPADAGFWDRLKYNITHLVSVRRIDEAQTGNSVQAIVGRAQAHLEREEVEAAMVEIKSLPDSARGNFASWLEDAQMVTEAPSLIDQIEEEAMQKAFHAEAKATSETPHTNPTKPEPKSSKSEEKS